MPDDDITTVKVSKDTWRRLNIRKTPGDSFDDVIADLLEQVEAQEGNPKTAATAD